MLCFYGRKLLTFFTQRWYVISVYQYQHYEMYCGYGRTISLILFFNVGIDVQRWYTTTVKLPMSKFLNPEVYAMIVVTMYYVQYWWKIYYRTNSSWWRRVSKNRTAQSFKLANSARIFINLSWYDSRCTAKPVSQFGWRYYQLNWRLELLYTVQCTANLSFFRKIYSHNREN